MNEIKRVYVSGPMRHRPRFNFPMFDAAEKMLRSLGFDVVNPAQHDRQVFPDIESWPGFKDGDVTKCPKFDYHSAIRWDLAQIAEHCDAIVMLPGWEQSTGAGHERYIAEACGLKVGHVYFGSNGELELFWEEPAAVVGLMGYAQTGKDTIGAYLVANHGFERISFADALKEVLLRMDPIVGYLGYQQRTDETMLRFGSAKKLIAAYGWELMKHSGAQQTEYNTRTYLQRLGVAAREILGDDVWANAALMKMQAGGKYVITDVRFENEANALRDMGAALVRVTRPGYGPVNGHKSETALDTYKADITLRNDGTLKHLYEQLDAIWTDDREQV